MTEYIFIINASNCWRLKCQQTRVYITCLEKFFKYEIVRLRYDEQQISDTLDKFPPHTSRGTLESVRSPNSAKCFTLGVVIIVDLTIFKQFVFI